MDDKGSSSADLSLLERLNALKPSVVSLDVTTNTIHLDLPTPASAAAVAGRGGDALSARLRTLRDRAGGPFEGDDGTRGADGGGAQPPLSEGKREDPEPDPANLNSPTAGGIHSKVEKVQDVDDPPFLPGEQDALDSFLEDLAWADDGGETVGDGVAVGSHAQPADFDSAEDESRRVEALLESLERNLPSSRLAGDDAAKGRDDAAGAESTDPEGGDVDLQADEIVSQALDDAKLEMREPSPESSPGRPNRPPSPSEEAPRSKVGGGVRSGGLPDDDAADYTRRLLPEEEGVESGAAPDGELSLPTVPSVLVDLQPHSSRGGGSAEGRKSLDFEADISARLAALKGLGSAVATDEWGMPSVPTFRPEDRAVVKRPSGSKARVGYTDEDMATWCIVCLDDATVRCVGCDDDVYCERCWREMHVGPSAGFDERGHKRVKFGRT